MLRKYQKEALEFSSIPEADAEGADVGHKGGNMADPDDKTVDDDVYKSTVDSQVEEGEADEGGANVVAKSIGADGSLFSDEESLMSDDDSEGFFEEDDDDGPAGRPTEDSEPEDETVSYGTDKDD